MHHIDSKDSHLLSCDIFIMAVICLQVDELQERSTRLENMCMARYEAGEQSRAYNEFKDRYNTVSTHCYGWY